jgi:hypothetical protein
MVSKLRFRLPRGARCTMRRNILRNKFQAKLAKMNWCVVCDTSNMLHTTLFSFLSCSCAVWRPNSNSMCTSQLLTPRSGARERRERGERRKKIGRIEHSEFQFSKDKTDVVIYSTVCERLSNKKFGVIRKNSRII